MWRRKQPLTQKANSATTMQQSGIMRCHEIKIPQSWQLQKCLGHHARDACSSSSVSGSRCPGAAAPQQPGSWSGWRAARCSRCRRHGPQGGQTDRHPGATRLQLLLLREKRWEEKGKQQFECLKHFTSLFCTIFSGLVSRESLNKSKSVILTLCIHFMSMPIQNNTKIKDHPSSRMKCEKPGDSIVTLLKLDSTSFFNIYM